MSDKVRCVPAPVRVVYKKRHRSLSLEQLIVVRKWLRESYRQCEGSGDKEGMEELCLVGRQISDIIDHITCRDGVFAEVIEW